eukprot:TRINITY_DN6154_c0_g1_i1.p2 TRINITY_DN6154_c0_g1~~TRINITY_DN6154_c0_g1_i1.p2  ORF type:complete len:190 (+),score=38.12 TRINITY_DN6154_c0_g1_i1:517-1086(+)
MDKLMGRRSNFPERNPPSANADPLAPNRRVRMNADPCSTRVEKILEPKVTMAEGDKASGQNHGLARVHPLASVEILVVIHLLPQDEAAHAHDLPEVAPEQIMELVDTHQALQALAVVAPVPDRDLLLVPLAEARLDHIRDPHVRAHLPAQDHLILRAPAQDLAPPDLVHAPARVLPHERSIERVPFVVK